MKAPLGKKGMLPGLLLLLLASGVVPLAGCGGGGGGGGKAVPKGGDNVTLAAIEVTPINPSVAMGTSRQFQATAIFSDTTKQDVTGTAVWSSSTAAATVNAEGLATGVSTGTTSIMAEYEGESGSTTLTVTSAILEALDVTPANPSLPAGMQQQFVATGIFSDGSTQPMTSEVTWSSTDNAVATASNDADTRGLVQALIPGSATITATFGVSASTVLTVTSATITDIEVTPDNVSIPLGQTQQFTATGYFSDNTAFDLTPQVAWSSSDTGVATVSDGGFVTALATGTADITAEYDGVSGFAPITVTPETLESIAITPVTSTIALGTIQVYQAIGTYSDSSTRDITDSVIWSSDNTSVALISNAAGTNGLATSVGVGSTTITAASGSIGSNSATLTVTSATLDSISVVPADPTIVSGTVVQFTAIGKYSDNSEQDLTEAATWSSSDPAVAVISNAPGTWGEATGVGAGSADITARVGDVTGTTTLTVVDATIETIVVTPVDTSISMGSSQQYTATGFFTGGYSQDITRIVKWTSSDKNVAFISNGINTRGLADADGVGTTTITATKWGITGGTTLTVTP